LRDAVSEIAKASPATSPKMTPGWNSSNRAIRTVMATSTSDAQRNLMRGAASF